MAFDSIEPLPVTTAPGRIADLIRSSILDGSLEPGSQLTESQLADRLQISRGPIREAMQRLVQEGLLWTKPHTGTFVIELGRDDIADIWLARRAVEGTAALRVIALGPSNGAFRALDDAVTGLKNAVASGEWSAIVDADLNFHEQVVAASDSVRLNRMFRTLTAETRLCLAAFVGAHPDWLKRAVKEHRNIVAAMRAGDIPLTVELFDKHFVLDETLTYQGDIFGDTVGEAALSAEPAASRRSGTRRSASRA